MIREYVKEFTTLVLEIPELSDQDSLFYFLDGLQGWAKMELERRGVQDLSTAIANAETLIDFSTRRDSSNPKDRKVNQEKGEGEKNAQPKVDAARKPPTGKDKNLKTSYKIGGCFICDGPHRARDFPKKASLNGLSAHEDKGTKAHLARDRTGNGKGTIDLSVVPMDDFKVVLGLEFLDKTCHGEHGDVMTSSGTKTLSSMPIQEWFQQDAEPSLFEASNKATDGMRVQEMWMLPKVDRAGITFKNKTTSNPPIFLSLMDLFDQLGKARYFTKLDLRSRYYQVQIAEGDEAKTTCVTRCSKVLRDKELYVKLEKCSFTQDEVEFLGHKIKDGGLMMDGAKIKAIQDWEPPTKVMELRYFLGLVNYYRRFIMGYSAIASPLTDLLKKNKAWIWDEDCQAAFESLKKEVMNTRSHSRAGNREKEVGRIARAFADAQGTMGECFHGLYHMLAKVGRGGSIIVVVDQFSKSEIHGALLDEVVQDHGDGFKLLHEFSSPNGQVNIEGECTIGALSLTLWKSPFQLVTRRQPLTPNALVASYEGSSPTVYKTMKEWHEQADLAWASLDKDAKMMKKWADERRRHVEFDVGDQVMVKLLPQQFKSLRKVHKGLIRRYKGPFSVIGHVGKGWEDVTSRLILRGYSGFRIVLHLTRRLSGILWKVGEGLGSSWKLMEDLEASCRSVIRKFSMAQYIGARGPVSVDVDFSSTLVMKRVSKTIGLLDEVAKINDPQCELLLIRACAGISKLYFAMRTCPPRVFESAQLSFDTALRSALERIVTASGPGFGEWQWRLATLPFAFGGLGEALLRHVGIVASGSNFDDALCAFNNAMEIDFLSNPNGLVAISKGRAYFGLASCGSYLWVGTDNETGDVYGDNAVSCAGVIVFKHRHNTVRDTLVDICFWSGISAGKEVDIGLGGGCDKALRPADMLLYSWEGGLDVCVDLTGSSPLTQTRMSDFVPGQAVIDAAQRKRGKYMTKCADIGYGFLPFSFSSFGELEKDAMALWTSQREDHTSDWLRTIPISGLGQTMNVDIWLDGGRDKPLRPADMLLYSWDGGLDVCVDLTGSSPLTQTGMVDFIPGRAMIDAAQRKCGKYMAKCAAVGYGFLPFSFSSLGELEADAVTLLKRIRKFFMTQDIEARAVVHIFNRISFAIAKKVEALIVSRLPSNLLSLLYDSTLPSLCLCVCPKFLLTWLFVISLRAYCHMLLDLEFSNWHVVVPHYIFAFGGLGVYSAGDVLNYVFLASRLQSVGLQTKLLRHTGIDSPEPIFDDALSMFNTSMETDLLSNQSEIAAPKLMKKMADIYFTRVTKNAKSTFSLSPRQMALWTSQMEDHTSDGIMDGPLYGLRQLERDIYGDHDVSRARIIGILNIVIMWCAIPLSTYVIVLGFQLDGGLDVFVDLTGSSPLTQMGWLTRYPSWAVFMLHSVKRDKLWLRCAEIGYGCLPFLSFFGGLEADG
ncbi:hypothetical protein Tco_1079692 [Tanacetum coccineum]|uniref:Reverse transcriptase domain-containing protein n=1 Tax=Tanacetum coccineum TaxID=301880 RepID=A0ABQ5HU80_9ASTR